MLITRRQALVFALIGVASCGRQRQEAMNFVDPKGKLHDPVDLHPGETAQLRVLINKWADHYAVPRTLVHRSIQRESHYNPGARNGPYYGLMQIMPQTARTMGHRGPANELLDPDTHLKYSVKYLRGAWMCADGSEDRAIMWYAKGYYYEAKRRGILKETGLRA